MSLAYTAAQRKTEVLFSEIEDQVLAGRADAGLVIHETRFTYAQRGLSLIRDLGVFWEQEIGQPIPLGGIAVKNDLSPALQREVNGLIRQSLEFAWAHPELVMPYVRCHAQAMEDEVMHQHISLYVNDYTLTLGEKGREAVETLFDMAAEKNIIKKINRDYFVNHI